MAHPMQANRADKMEKQRVGKITAGCYAAGGGVPTSTVTKASRSGAAVPMRADGGAVQARADRPNRAKGGRTRSKGAATVNVIVAPSANKPPMPAGAGPAAPPPPMGAPTPMAPPMRPPPSAAIPAAPGPIPMPPRADGGRAYKRGGAVSAADKKGTTGIGDRTPIQHSGNKSDTQNIGRAAPITRKTGGPVWSDGRKGKQMGPHLPGGSGGGKERLVGASGKLSGMNRAYRKQAAV